MFYLLLLKLLTNIAFSLCSIHLSLLLLLWLLLLLHVLLIIVEIIN